MGGKKEIYQYIRFFHRALQFFTSQQLGKQTIMLTGDWSSWNWWQSTIGKKQSKK